MIKFVLVRHGESVWNLENKFTGWTDVDLSKNGLKEAVSAGKDLKAQGYIFDVAYTSVLKRANRTLDIILDELKLSIPIYFSWKLNERHYGALQGLNKQETAKIYGKDQVQLWRRSLSTRPPVLSEDDPRYPGLDPKYKNLSKNELPTSENLLDTVKRVVEYWKSDILPAIHEDKKVLIVAHGNSLRALIKYLDNVSDEEIMNIELPTGKPLIYEYNELLDLPIKHYYL
ncbi:MAG: 2,3-diphosphoglycerate-dependent phosphoglycerate mutase [Candidatus Izemoplasmatales bacterium]|jgi:2,3-bisphosphoglycerate-dependent phosphoglycerate mutase|nr:2,3-diphosphoglycerate-dependent phosphoglycerate mutase [Candidatus Izemoplasmatales bacterium]MDD3923419.1 2,3-diphosphoglycerate-dependent phosphoglycerate mutase [Endomicrobiaceae bacterium]